MTEAKEEKHLHR